MAVLRDLPAAIRRPAYDPARARIGIVHFGPGAFHRAHQAACIDDLLGAHPEWAICGVSLHNLAVREALAPQDLLFSLALLGERDAVRVIASLRELLHAPTQQATVLERLADPAVRLATLTVTEKGYCLAGEELDLAHPDIAHDLAAPATPRSVIGYLVAGLAARRRLGLPAFSVLSCDNLAGNGRKLRRATLQYASRLDASLARWIEREATFPCSMVDSITPATDATLRQQVSDALGCIDAWPVQRESFAQWVIEDDFRHARPPLEQAGATFTRDIAGYDRAKLRLLNGAHSALAYLGSLLGLEAVRDAMRCAPLARFVERLMKECILPVTALPTDLDGNAYADTILERFRNPAIHHRLSQIAWDGSQKLPVRLLPSIAEALAQGRDIGAFCLPVSAWLQFVRRQARAGVPLVDPLDEVLRGVGRACTGDAGADISGFLGLDAVFGPLGADARFTAALRDAYALLGDGSAAAVTRALA